MKRYLLVGPSGVGKASFANNLVGRELFCIDPYTSTQRLEVQVGELPQGIIELSILRGWDEDKSDSESWLRRSIQELLQNRPDAILYFVPLNITRIDLRPGGGTGPTCYRRILNCLRESCESDSPPPVWIVFTMCSHVVDVHFETAIRIYTNYVDFWLSHKRDGIQAHSPRLFVEKVIFVDNMHEDWREACVPLWKTFIDQSVEQDRAWTSSAAGVSYQSVGHLLPEHPATLVYWHLETSSQHRGTAQ